MAVPESVFMSARAASASTAINRMKRTNKERWIDRFAALYFARDFTTHFGSKVLPVNTIRKSLPTIYF